MKSKGMMILLLAAAMLPGCGSSDADSGGGGSNTGGSGGSDTGGSGGADTGGSGGADTGGSGGSDTGGSGGSDTGGSGGSNTGGSGGTGCGDLTSDPLNCGSCGHSCRGGECVEGVCQPIVIRDPYFGRAFVVDGTSLYHVEQNYGDDPKEVMAGPLTPLAADSSLGVHDDIELPSFLEAGENLFWKADKDIKFMSKKGGQVSSIAANLGSSAYYVPVNDRVYVLEHNIYSYSLSEGTAVNLTESTPQWDYYTSEKLFWDGQHFFVPKTGLSGQGRVLFRVPANGSAGAIVLDLPGWVIDMVFSGSSVLGLQWTSGPTSTCSSSPSSSRIWKAAKTGGAVSDVLVHPSLISAMKVDDTHIYFADQCKGTLWRIPIAGGTAEMLFDVDSSNYRPTLMLTAQGLYFHARISSKDQLLLLPK